MVRRSMKDWGSNFYSADFIRASRDALINLHHVERIESTGSRGGQIWLQKRPDPAQASFRLFGPTVAQR